MKIYSFLQIVFLIVCFGCVSPEKANEETLGKVHFLDVGQGLAVLLEYNSRFALYDTGPDSVGVTQILKSFKVDTLEWVVLSHFHRDHIGGFLEFSKPGSDIFIKNLFVGKNFSETFLKDSVFQLAKLQKIPLQTISRGDSLFLGNTSQKILFQVLWPPLAAAENKNDSLNENAKSLVLFVPLKKSQSGSAQINPEGILLTGDSDLHEEEKLLLQNGELRASLLQVAHHGSLSSSSLRFLETVAPLYAVISVGKANPYQHPALETLNKLKYILGDSSRIFRTDQSGNICFAFDAEIGIWPCE